MGSWREIVVNILLVEDNEMNRDMIGRRFAKKGYRVELAVDGYDALAKMEKDHYDLILLDAFNGDYIPEHLMSAEFFEEVKKLLPANGMVVANTFSSSRLYSAESQTYAQVFGKIFNTIGVLQPDASARAA